MDHCRTITFRLCRFCLVRRSLVTLYNAGQVYSSTTGLCKVIKGLWEGRLAPQLLLQSHHSLFSLFSQSRVCKRNQPEGTSVLLVFVIKTGIGIFVQYTFHAFMLPFTWLVGESDPSDLLERCVILFSASTALPVLCNTTPNFHHNSNYQMSTSLSNFEIRLRNIYIATQNMSC